MSEQTTAKISPETTQAKRLVPTALAPFRALTYAGATAGGLAVILLFIAFTGGYVEPAILAAALLILAAPLFAGAGIIAGLGKRE